MLPARRDKDQLTLENVHEIFARWRKNKTGRSPIPEALWKAAVSLTDCYSVNKIASYLHLNYNGNAPLDACIWEQEKFRCNLCGEIFTAKLPDEAGSEKYDPSAGCINTMPKLKIWLHLKGSHTTGRKADP